VGGNLLGVEPFTVTVHGYFVREFFASDFGVANLEVQPATHPGTCRDCPSLWRLGRREARAARRTRLGEYLGVGAGLSFRAIKDIDWLIKLRLRHQRHS